MRPLRALGWFALAVFGGGALLGPCLYWLAQWVADAWPQWHGLAGKPLHRYVLRATMLIAVGGLWPLLRQLGARSWADLGVVPPRGQWQHLGIGVSVGFVSLAVVTVLALLCGARRLDGGLTGGWWARFPDIAATSVVIGVLEELLYRGAIFGGLRRGMDWRWALWVSSALYAAMHFLRQVNSPAEVHWWSGLALLPQMAGVWTRVDLLLPDFLTLLLAGMVLGLGYQRTGNLYFSMGLHAGWVFWLRYYGHMTDRQPGSLEWWWGSGKLYDGWIAFVTLAAVGFLVWRRSPTRTNALEHDPRPPQTA